jgi:hypothetical protein
MIDARFFVEELETARRVLATLGADYKGEYVIHDAIYTRHTPPQDIADVFLRLRSVPKNIWDEKPFIVALKQTEQKVIGKQSHIPVKKQFDTQEAAQAFIDTQYGNSFSLLYEFDRVGWQYNIGTDQVDLEDIEGHYSIECKSPTEEGLQKLLLHFNPAQIIVGPSVVAVKELLGR